MKSSERKEIKKKKKEQKSASREEKRIKKSKPFEKVIKRSINVYSILLIVLAGALALFICFQLMGMKYGYDAQRLAEVAATYVDGDTIDKYLEIAEKGDAEAAENDEEYKKVREKLDNLCYAAGLTDIYIYIYKEEEKEVVVLWHVVEKDAGKEARPIGTRAKVDKEIQKKIDEGRKGGRGTLDYLERYNMEMEPAISAMRAVTDGYGDMVAMASAEFEISWSYVWIIIFSLCFFPPLIILALMFNFIYKRSVKRKIVKPIKRLAKATTELVDKLESDEEIAVRTKSRVTEFNDLAVAFTSMGNDLRNYFATITDITKWAVISTTSSGSTKTTWPW